MAFIVSPVRPKVGFISVFGGGADDIFFFMLLLSLLFVFRLHGHAKVWF
jgi:hypothetical protein